MLVLVIVCLILFCHIQNYKVAFFPSHFLLFCPSQNYRQRLIQLILEFLKNNVITRVRGLEVSFPKASCSFLLKPSPRNQGNFTQQPSMLATTFKIKSKLTLEKKVCTKVKVNTYFTKGYNSWISLCATQPLGTQF